MKARQAALHTIDGVINQHRTLNTLLAQDKSRVSAADQALYQALVYGTLRQYRALSALCAQMMEKPPATPGHPLAIILNLGDHGVINETVNLAPHHRLARAKGLINAILRRVQRERAHWQQALENAATANLPDWLCGQYPAEEAAIAASNSRQPPLTLRLNHTHDRAAWLAAHGDARANPLHPQAITLTHGHNVQHIPGFNTPPPCSPHKTANTSWTPALPPAAKPATCSNSHPPPNYSRLTTTATASCASKKTLIASACAPPSKPQTPPIPPPGGTANPSTPSSWTPLVAAAACCAATRTSPGCVPRPI